MKFNRTLFNRTIVCFCSGLLLTSQDIALSQESQRRYVAEEYYQIDGYDISMSTTLQTEILSEPCDLQADNSFETCVMFGSPGHWNGKLVAVLPEITGSIPTEVFRQRYEYEDPSYPAQNFVLTVGHLAASIQQSNRVISVERNADYILVTIDVNNDESKTGTGILRAQVFQIDLGYLEPGQYHFEARFNHKINGVLNTTYTRDPVFFQVTEAN